MKLGFIISSLKQSIPYMTYFVGNGYDVLPILLDGNIDCKKEINLDLKSIIENITGKAILDNDLISEEDKLDCLIIMSDTFQSINYHSLLKENAPIIISRRQKIKNNYLSDTIVCDNMYFINYESVNIIDNCNVVISNLNKILQKK